MKAVDLMIFDFDGTLADTRADMVASVNHTLTTLCLEPRAPKEIISFVGDGLRKLIEKSLGDKNADCLDQALVIFSDHYENHFLDFTVLYPQIEDVLNNFQDKKKVILTNKRYYLAVQIANGLGIEKYFMEIVGADSTPFLKPDPRVVEYLLSKYSTLKEKAIIIGDGVNDIAVAKNAGILSCSFLNGLGDKETLLEMGADFYCESLIEINDLFQ
jgi:phosphoglycolate phosphatase